MTKPKSPHGCSFHYAHRAKVWVAECKCGEEWHDARYTEVERLWALHVKDNTGHMPRLSQVDL